MSKILVIGGTTKGIGRRFVDLMDVTHHRLFVPEPEMLDVRRIESIQSWVSKNGPIDYLMYCAGIKHLSWIKDIDMDDLHETFEVNVFGFINVLRELLLRNAVGRACVITSDAAINPKRTSIDYCASKSALEMAIRVAARELPGWHITGIRPSVVSDTEMTNADILEISELRGWAPSETYKLMGQKIPAQDVADLAHWLLFSSPQSLTGSIIDIRGGQ
jgi:NAD(P)-dependent dehydrogenase (short-subunit alcohol dehydrogenase family)